MVMMMMMMIIMMKTMMIIAELHNIFPTLECMVGQVGKNLAL